MKYLFLNNGNIDVCLPPYLRINMTIWLKRQIPDFDISCQQYIYLISTGFKTKQKIKEIMRYMGGHRTSPFTSQVLIIFDRVVNLSNFCKAYNDLHDISSASSRQILTKFEAK